MSRVEDASMCAAGRVVEFDLIKPVESIAGAELRIDTE